MPSKTQFTASQSVEKRMLWVLSEVYYPEETGTGYYITLIAQHLGVGRDVSVLCAQPSYSKLGVKAPRYEIRERVAIHRCWSLVTGPGSIAMRFLRMVSITLAMGLTAMSRIRRGDAILAVTNPPSVPILAAVLSFLLGVPYILIVHDIYPDILAACGMSSRKSISFKVLHRLSRSVLIRASQIICIGRDMRVNLALTMGEGNGNGIKVIPLWSDYMEIVPRLKQENELVKELGLERKFVVLYAGNMGHPHDIETLAEVIEKMGRDAFVHFVFIGSGHKRKIIEGLIEKGVGNLTLLDARPRSEQDCFLNCCDVAIISLVDGMLGLAVPSRTYNLMAAGKPIIAIVPESSEVACVVREEQIGWVVEPGSVERTRMAIERARDQEEGLLQMGKRARKLAETKYSQEAIFQQFDEVLGDVDSVSCNQDPELTR